MFQGQKHALQAVDLNEGDFESLRWAAVTTGQLTDHLGTKEKIEQGAKFKVFASVTNVSQCWFQEYLDKALALNGREYTLLHMRGRYAFSVAGLSWIERKVSVPHLCIDIKM